MIARARVVLCALALAAASACEAAPAVYGPPQPPAPPDGYARDASDGALIVWRPPSPGRTTLVVAEDEPRPSETEKPDLLQIARARSMTIVFLGADRGASADRLRGAVAALRGAGGLVGVAAGAKAGALRRLGEGARQFDALLLVDAPPTVDFGADGPFVIELYGSDAFWRAAAAPPSPSRAANRRRFFLAGAALAREPAGGASPDAINDRAIDPALRALLVALDEFLHGGPPPPASREADLAPKKSLQWPKLPGAAAAPPGDGLAPKIDVDGNETSGLRLPDQALPLSTFTGWNAARDCAAGQKFDFAPSREAREAVGDPRLSLVERYGSRAYFVAALRSVGDRLVKERLLLPQDADAYVAAGKKAPF